MDAEVRRLEVNLATAPSDLELRQRLLNAYLRSGVLRRGDIADLAALGDPAAMAMWGRPVDLQSRSKRFYLRCAWVSLLPLLDELPKHPATSAHLEPSTARTVELIDDTTTVFRQLMNDYLSNRATLDTGRHVKYFRADATATIPNFGYIFKQLERDFRHVALPIRHQVCSSILIMLQLIASAARANVKRDTDKILHLIIFVRNILRGTNYQPYAHENNSVLWQELIDQGVISAIPVAHPTLRDQYYELSARQLLRDNRDQIIRHWLPNYTP